MNEKQKKKALKRLYGRNTKNELTISITATIILLASAIIFYILPFSEGIEIILLLFTVIIGELLYFIFILIGHFKHSKELVERYEDLPNHEKEDLLHLAHIYTCRDGIVYNDK